MNQISSQLFSLQQQTLASLQSYPEAYMNALIALEKWGEAPAPAYEGNFAADLGAILSRYYSENQPNITPEGLQNFLNSVMSTTDFCQKYPGIDPSTVSNFLSMFGVESPYVYTPLDTAYAQVSLALQGTTQQPDEGVLQSIASAMNAAFSTNDDSAVLEQIRTIENSSAWSQLSPSTRSTIWSIAQKLNG